MSNHMGCCWDCMVMREQYDKLVKHYDAFPVLVEALRNIEVTANGSDSIQRWFKQHAKEALERVNRMVDGSGDSPKAGIK